MADENTTHDSGGDQEETVESLKEKLTAHEARIEELTAESTKHKNLRRQAERERDAAKKSKPDDSEDGSGDYKKLWKETNDKLSKSLERAKKADINSALTAQFGTAKVASDRFGAALKLIDHSLVEWNEDAGVDSASVVAAVQKLKSEHSFLFENAVDATTVKTPGDAGSKNTISRSIFDALSNVDKVAKMKAGVKITD